MSSLVEVSIDKIKMVNDIFNDMRKKGEALRDRMRKTKITYKKFKFFERETTQWDYLVKCPGTIATWAFLLDYCGHDEAKALDFVWRDNQWANMVKHGERVFLTKTDLAELERVLTFEHYDSAVKKEQEKKA